ncbi:MAG: TIGR02206 family membrane protein [Anaerolineales bacterium]|nr:TIGR02206 family membrane protein [Anaerolineales bacterium]
MYGWIDPNYSGEPFQLFGPKHIIVVAFFALVILWLFLGWKNPTEQAKKRFRVILIAILLFWEGAWHGWNIWAGTWTLQEHLPLHVCSVMVWSSIFMLLTRNYRIYEFVYFMGIAGAMQAFLTPEAGKYGLWHFRAMQTLIVHGTLIVTPIYLTLKEGFRPTWRSFLRVAIGMNIYMVIVFFINRALGSNYLFIMQKPPSASLLDVLGPWPWYILAMEAIGFTLFFLLYLPWVIKDARGRRQALPA